MGKQRHVHLEDPPQHTITESERSHWILNSPNPPPLWNKIFSTVKHAFLPHTNNKYFSPKHALSFLQTLFPILVWFRDYKPSHFKNDLLAGLTLASLSIPQVHIYICIHNAEVSPTYYIYAIQLLFSTFFFWLFKSCRA